MEKDTTEILANAQKQRPHNQKQDLLNKIVSDPLDFDAHSFAQLVDPKTALSFTDLRQLLMRIFDINESTLRVQSDATTSVLGFMNKCSTWWRHRRYYRKIRQGFRSPSFPGNKVIVAEGDSWFQFPFFVKDIVDWLNEVPRYAVYSIAYGGDWFTNILYEEKYIEELSIHLPDVFLISGGGNDFVGSNRLAIMVNAAGNCSMRPEVQRKEMLLYETDRNNILEGYRYINPAFYSFIWVLKAQYFILFRNLKESGKFNHMRIITQGYDNAIPTYKTRWRKWYSLQPMLNGFIGSGKWMKRPLMIKGITDAKTSERIIKATIFEINHMFAELAATFPQVYHIDCRGTARSPNDWFDELHLHSERFKAIAATYQKCIEDPSEKVLRVMPRDTSAR